MLHQGNAGSTWRHQMAPTGRVRGRSPGPTPESSQAATPGSGWWARVRICSVAGIQLMVCTSSTFSACPGLCSTVWTTVTNECERACGGCDDHTKVVVMLAGGRRRIPIPDSYVVGRRLDRHEREQPAASRASAGQNHARRLRHGAPFRRVNRSHRIRLCGGRGPGMNLSVVPGIPLSPCLPICCLQFTARWPALASSLRRALPLDTVVLWHRSASEHHVAADLHWTQLHIALCPLSIRQKSVIGIAP